MHSKRRGPKAKIPTTEFGLFVQQHLDTMNITRAELAKRLKVSAATVVRMLNGDTSVIQRVRPENICEALGLDEMNRRKFLEIASAASFALATGRVAPEVIVRHKTDIDLVDDHLKTLQYLLDQGGQAQHVGESAQLWSNRLLQEYPDTKDVRVAKAQVRSGLLLGNAQELVLPWYQRTDAIETYNAIEENIISRFPLNTFQEERATLLSHRAPRYRELGDHRKSLLEYDDGIDVVRKINNPSLRSTLFRLRVHSHAILGNEFEWRRLLDEAYKDVEYLAPAYRDGTRAMLINMEAEGYKRLAFNPRKELSRQMRAGYVQKSLQSFQYFQEIGERNPQSLHLAIQMSTERSLQIHFCAAQVSEAQALILIDPEAAIQMIEKMWSNTSTFYPALLPKMRDILRFAQGLLSKDKLNPLLMFSQDVFPSRRKR
jgi:hypothetical protein